MPRPDGSSRESDLRAAMNSAEVRAAAAVAPAMSTTMSAPVSVRDGWRRRQRGDDEQRNGRYGNRQPTRHR